MPIQAFFSVYHVLPKMPEGNAEKLMAQIESQKDTINSLIKQQKDEEAAQIQAQRQAEAAADFYEFILSDEAKEVFDSYYFDTDVER